MRRGLAIRRLERVEALQVAGIERAAPSRAAAPRDDDCRRARRRSARRTCASRASRFVDPQRVVVERLAQDLAEPVPLSADLGQTRQRLPGVLVARVLAEQPRVDLDRAVEVFELILVDLAEPRQQALALFDVVLGLRCAPRAPRSASATACAAGKSARGPRRPARACSPSPAMIVSSSAIDGAWPVSSVSASRRCASAAFGVAEVLVAGARELDSAARPPSRPADRAAARTARADPRSALRGEQPLERGVRRLGRAPLTSSCSASIADSGSSRPCS